MAISFDPSTGAYSDPESGVTLENVEFVDIAEGTTIKTTGTGAVDAATVTNPSLAPVYDETTGGYVFETLETSTDTLFVDDDWTSLAEGTVVQIDGKNYRVGLNAFGSIQAAVDAAADGATVNVAAGSYAEDVKIAKGITINGAEGHASAVRSFGIGADNVTIDGFAIAPTNQNCYGSGEMPLAAGVYLTAGGAGAPLQNISVVNNTIDCSGVMADGVKATGVAFGTGSSSHFSTNVMVMNNTITGGGSSTAQNGLYLRFVDGAVVSGNTINGFSHHLAQFETGGNYTVAENVLSDTNRNGLQFGGVTTGTNVVSGNDISDCRGTSSDDGALVLRNDGDEGAMEVTGNSITGNNTGVYISEVTNVDNLTVTGNLIDLNTTDIVSNSASDITLTGNNYGSDGAVTNALNTGKLDVGGSVSPVAGVALILVNANYAGKDTVLGPDGNFYKVGENAFANMKDAAPAITADTLEVRVTGKVSWPGNQTVDMSAASGKNTITFNDITDGSNIGAYRTYIKGNGSTVVAFNNVNGSCNIFLSKLEEVSIVGNSTVDLTAYNNFDSQSTKSFTNVGKLTVTEGSTCHFANANQFGLGDTVISGAGTIKSSGTLILSGDNSQFTGVLEIANGVQMESVESGFANASQIIINNGTMYCNAAGTFVYNQTIVGDGMIKAWVQNAGTEVVLTGDISGYTGKFDALSGNTIKLNTTLNDTVNLAHSSGAAGTIELNGDGTPKDIIINSTTNTTTGLKVFANWNNVTVQSNGNDASTVLGTIYFGGNGNSAAAEDLDVSLSWINVTGGKSIGNLYFGGIGNTVVDTAADADANAISVVVDTIYETIVGGGQQSTITGDITFDVVTGASGAEIVGAGEGNTVNGNIFINVDSADDASVGNITGGRAVQEVSGNIAIAVAGGTVGNVYGVNNADANGTSVRNIQIDVTGGTVSTIRGGNSSAGKVPGVFEAESVKINLSGGEVTGKIYGGSQLSTESIAIVVNGGEAADIYAGSKYAAVGTASIEVKDGSVGSIYGGGAGGTDDIGYSTVKNAAIRVSGGTVNGEIYGGGTEGDVTTSATVTITGGTITDDIYGGGYGEATVTTAQVVVSGEKVTFSEGKINIYGGGNGSGEGSAGSTNTVGSASVALSGVNQGEAMVYVYGGGVYGTQQVTESKVTVTDSSVWAVYGGTASGYGAIETAEVVIDGSQVSGDVYGGGAMATAMTGSASVTLTGSSVVSGDVYGGGFNGGVTGDVAVNISGATVNGDVNLGSWSGSATVGGTATLTISGGNNVLEGITANGVAGGSTIDVQDGTQIAGVTSDGTLKITGNGIFTSGITAAQLTADALSFEVTKEELANGTLINLTGSDSAVGTVTVKVTDGDLSSFDGTQLISGDPGQGFDLTLTDGTNSATIETAVDTVLANSNWADFDTGSVVLYNGKFYEIGTNAFGTFADAIAGFGSSATANQDTAEIIFASDNESGESGTKYYLYTDTDLALTTDGTPRTVTINGERLYLMNVYALDSEFKPIPNPDLPTVTIGEGLTLITEGLLNVGQNVDQTDVEDGQPTRDAAAMSLVVDGTLVTRLYVASNSEVVVSETGRILMGAKEAFITRTGSKMTVDGDGSKDEVQFEVNYTSMQGGVLTLNDTWMKSGVVWLNASDQGFDNKPSTLVLNNSRLESSSKGAIQSGSTISAANGSEITFAGVMENAGAITLDASSFTAKELANTGTFQVSGTSTLNIGTLTGEVELLDGAVLTDSQVGGKVTTEGDVTIAGTTTLGQLVLEGARGDDRTIVIDENATVSLGHLDVGIGLQNPDLVPGDRAERVYYGHVLVKGALSVDKANQSGAIYIRPYAELVVTGTLDVKGEVHNRGSLVVNGGTMTMTDWLTPKLLGYDPTGDRLTITNHGTMTVAGAGAVTFGEASASVQHIDAEPQYADGMFATISEGGQFLADTLAFANDGDVTLRVTGAGSLFKLYSADGREATNAYNYAQNEGTIIVEDQAVFDVSELANTNFANSGSLELAGGSASFATLTNNGTVDLDNGTLSSVGAVDNSGTMNFANAVDANTIANSGVVNFKGGAEFQGEITGNGDVQYMGEGNKLTGDVSAKKFIVGLEGDDAIATSLEISGGATVKVTGGGNSGRIGVNTDVVITGEGTTFTDQANLTMDESATLEISNGAEVNIGYLATGGKTDVTGATLNLTGGVGTAGASAIGGLHDATEFNVNAGGVVNAQNGLVIGHRETKDGLVNVIAGGELHVSGGALKVSGLVGDYDVQGNGTLNVNGGTVTADNGGDNGLIVGDAWDGASGILKVTNGGSITAGYSIQLNSTSRVTIDGGSMSAQQLYQSEGGELSIVNGGSVTLTNAYFAMGGKITVGDAESGKISRLETGSSGETGPASLGGDYGTHAGETVLNIEENGEVVLGTGLIVGHRADSTVSKDATVNVNAGGKLELANQLQLGSTGEYQAAGTVNVLGGTVDASAAEVTINSRGVLKVEDGAFSAGTVTNNGAVSITGESTVVAKFNAAGTGSVEIAGATLGAGSGINRLESSDVASQFGSNITLKDTVTVTDGAWLGTGWTGSLTMGFGTGDSGVLNITDGAVVSVGGPLYFGSEKAALDDGIFELNISGVGSLLQSHGASGEYYITGDAVVTVTDGGALTNPGRVRSGATYVFGAVGDTNAATVEFRRTELVETAQVTIQGGAVADLGELVFGDDQMAYDGSFTLAADSQLKLDSYSSFRGVGEITVTGVDADQTAIRKLIDYTGSGSIDYTTVIANWDKIAELVTVINNDLYLGSADMSMLKVNSAWLNLEPGTEVETGFFYGFNAFDNMNQAVSALDRSYVLGDTFGTPVTVELTDATSGALDLYGLNLVLTGNLTSSGSWNTALVSSPSSDPNYISYLKLDKAQIKLTGNAALEGVNWGKAAVSFDKEGNIVAPADQTIQRGAIVELVNETVFDADNQINGRGVFFKLDGTSRIYQHGSSNSLITMTSGAIIDGGVEEAGTYNQLNQLDALWVYFGKGSGEWAGIYGDKAYFTFRNGANIEAGNRIEFGTGSLLNELDVEIDSSRVASVGNIIIGTEGNAGKITSFTVADHSLLEAGTDLSIVGTTVALSDSTLNAATVTFGAEAVLVVSGASAVDAEFAADGAGLVSFNDATLDAATRINETASYEVNTVGSEIELNGTNVLTDGAFVSTGWAKNLRIGFDTAAEQARVKVTGGATLQVGGAAYLGSNAENRGAGAFAVAVSGAGSRFAGAGADGSLYVRADGLLTVTDQASAAFSYLQNKGTIEISNAAFSANDLVITATGSVSVSDQSAFAVSGEITLAGQLTTDYRTMLAFGGLIDAGGKLTIDMSGYTDGIYKLMDYTGTGSFSQGDYIALLGSENYRSDYAVINGDLYVINAPELKINAAWEGKAFAQEVEDGFFYGLNAFGNLDEVYQKVSEPGVSKITMASDVTMTDPSQVSGEMWFKFHDDVTIDSDVAGEQRVINISGAELMLTSRDQSRGNGGEQVSITLGEDLKIQTDSTIWFGYIFDDALQYPTYAGDFSADIVLAGEVNMTGGQAHLFGYSSTMTITETGSLTVAQSDIQTRGSQLTVNGTGKEMAQAQVQLNHENIEGDSAFYLGSDYYEEAPASWTLNHTYVNINTYLGINTATNSRASGIDAALNLNDSKLVIGTNLTMADAATVVADSQSELSVGGDVLLGYGQTIQDGASITLRNGSTLTAGSLTADAGTTVTLESGSTLNSAKVTNNGVLSFADSSLTATRGVVTNNGEMNVVDSSLMITGNGVDAGLVNGAGAILTLDNAAAYRSKGLGKYYGLWEVENEGSINLVNGSYLGANTLTNNGSIQLDYTSTLGLNSYSGSGTVKVDTTGYSGSGAYKLINDEQTNGTWTREDYQALLGEGHWRNDYMVVKNDLFLTDADQANFYVNTAWSELEEFDAIAGYDHVYYGLNGYDIGSEAIRYAVAGSTDVTVHLESDAGATSGGLGTIVWELNNTTTVTADEARTLTLPIWQTGANGFHIQGAGHLVFDENVTLHWTEKNGIGDQSLYIGSVAGTDSGPVVEIKGAMVVDQAFNIGEHQVAGATSDPAGELILHEGATLSVGSQFVMRGNGAKLTLKEGATATLDYATLYGGTLTADGAVLETQNHVYLGWQPNATDPNKNYGTSFALNLTGSTFTVGTDLTVSKTNSAGATNDDYRATVNLDGSRLVVNGAFLNDQTIHLANASTLEVDGTVTNAGTIEVFGSSTLSGAFLNQGGSLNFGSAEESVDAQFQFSDLIGGYLRVVNGTVTATGSNEAQASPSTVVLVGSGDWSAEGDARITADDAAGASLNLGGESVLKINQLRIGNRADNGTSYQVNVTDSARLDVYYGGAYLRYGAELNVTGAEAAASAKLLSNGGAVTIDAGSFTATGTGSSFVGAKAETGNEERLATLKVVNGATATFNGDLAVGFSDDVLRRGNLTVNGLGSTLTVTGALSIGVDATQTEYVSGYGELVVTGGAVVSAGTISVNSQSSISLDYASTLRFGNLENAGAITINLEGYAGNEKLLVLDYTGSGELTVDDYRNLLGAGWNNTYFVVENSDLYVSYDSAVVYVCDDYTEGGENDGHTWGVDAFADLESAKAVNPLKIITVSCTVEDIQGMDGIPVEIQEGTFQDHVYGGNADFDNTVVDNSQVEIAGGEFNRVFGGNLVDLDSRDSAVVQGDAKLDVLSDASAKFNGVVSGSDRILGGQAERIGTVNMNISGGTFNNRVVGGAVLETPESDIRGYVIHSGDINLMLSGGTYNHHVFGGNLSAYLKDSSRTYVEGNINLVIDCSERSVTFGSVASGEAVNIIAGSSGYGSVLGDVSVTIRGDQGLEFSGILCGGSEGAYYQRVDGVRECVSYVSGARDLTFTSFEGTFNGLILAFESIGFDGNSQVSFTNSGLNLSDISEWEFEFGSSFSGLTTNDFTGDSLNLDLTGWDELSDWEIASGSASAFTGWNDLSNTVRFGDQLASWNDELSSWCTADYQLGLKDDEENKVLFVSKLA